MDGLTSDNLKNADYKGLFESASKAFDAAAAYSDLKSVKMFEAVRQLQAARFAMHKVRLYHYQLMVRNGIMSSDLAKQYYLAAMSNYDDMMKSAASGSFSDAIKREMEDFDINEAFAV